jgi:hypothetical protein
MGDDHEFNVSFVSELTDEGRDRRCCAVPAPRRPTTFEDPVSATTSAACR